MSDSESDFKDNSITALVIILVVSLVLLGAFIIPALSNANNGTISDEYVKNGKKDGSICLTAAESWNNIGKTTCVVFRPDNPFISDSGYMFLNEKKDYKKGFTAFFAYKNMMSKDKFWSQYRSANLIAVYGQITTYEGHPQIKVYNTNQITTPKLISCETSYGCIYSK